MPAISFDAPAVTTLAFETSDSGEKWGTLTAIDLKAKDKILWQHEMEDPLINRGAGMNAPPVSYAVDGKQHILGRLAATRSGTCARRPFGGFRTGRLVAYGVQSKDFRPNFDRLEHGK